MDLGSFPLVIKSYVILALDITFVVSDHSGK